MGTEYYLLCESKKEYFELARHCFFVDFDFTGESTKEEFIREIEKEMNPTDPEELAFDRKFGSLLYDWCKAVDWKIRVMNDCEPDFEINFDEWKQAGSAYEIRVGDNNDIRLSLEKRIEDIRNEFGADSVTVIMTIGDSLVPSSYGDDDYEDYYWQYHAVNGYDTRGSGYEKVVCKEGKKSLEDDEY